MSNGVIDEPSQRTPATPRCGSAAWRESARRPAPGSIAPGALRSASGMTLVTPEARFASRKIGRVHRSMSPGASSRLSTSARCCAIRKPCVRTAALGSPVDPLVNVMIAGVSASQGSTLARPHPRRARRNRRGARHPAADRGLDRNGANRRGRQAKPVSAGHGDEGVGPDAGDAAIQPLAPGRRIDEHRRRPAAGTARSSSCRARSTSG